MSFRSILAKSTALRTARVMTAAAAALVVVGLSSEPIIHAQPAQRGAPPKVHLPDEAVGIDGIAGALISVYDQFDVVALGEYHERQIDSNLRIALVRHPDFAKKVQTIVVEFATTMEQTTLDRYIRGEDISRAQLERVKPRQGGSLVSDDPIYPDFFTAVREVNSKLPAAARIRVFGGEDNQNRVAAAVSILKEQTLQKHGKALVIYGAGHFYRAIPEDQPPGNRNTMVTMLEKDFPGRTFAVIPVGGPGDNAVNYQRFDRALNTQVRPVLVPAQRLPFREFTAEEFLGGQICRAAPGGCVSIFKGSTLTLGQMGDAFVYFGRP
jgi:hypothetical protein